MYVQHGLMVGPLEGFADVWGSTFLRVVYQMDESIAASLPSLIFIGMCCGAPVLNWIAEKSGSYLGTIVGAGLVMAAGFGAMLLGEVPTSLLSGIFVIIGVCCAYQIIAIYLISCYVAEKVASLTTAVANMVIMVFGYVFHASIGWVVTASGGIEQSNSLIYGVSIIPLTLLLGAIGLFLMPRPRLQSLPK